MVEYTGCDDCRHSSKGLREYPCSVCIHNAIDKFSPKTNFDACCESVEAMAQFIDIAKVGWTKKQIIKWLKSEVKERCHENHQRYF